MLIGLSFQMCTTFGILRSAQSSNLCKRLQSENQYFFIHHCIYRGRRLTSDTAVNTWKPLMSSRGAKWIRLLLIHTDDKLLFFGGLVLRGASLQSSPGRTTQAWLASRWRGGTENLLTMAFRESNHNSEAMVRRFSRTCCMTWVAVVSWGGRLSARRHWKILKGHAWLVGMASENLANYF
nr:MAG: hypothetical protein [Sesarmops intermedium nimavirus]